MPARPAGPPGRPSGDEPCGPSPELETEKDRVISMKFRPLHDRVVVEPLEEDEKTAGGIIIPDTDQEKPMQGQVLAAGPGARADDGKLVALHVKRGDKVPYGRGGGTAGTVAGQSTPKTREE